MSLCLLAALVATLPAQLIVHWFPVAGLDTHQALITGPWWHARMQYGVWAGMPITNMTVSLQPQLSQWQWSNWQVTWQTPITTGQTDVTWPLQDGQLHLRQATVNVDLAQLPLPNIDVFGVLGIDGQAQLTANAVSVNLRPTQQQDWRYWLQQIELAQPIDVTVQPLFIAVKNNYGGILNTQMLGQGQAKISSLGTNNGYQVTIDFAQAPTLINGSLTFAEGMLASNVALRLTATTPDILAQLLPLVAKHNGQNNYQVIREWRL